MHGQQISPEELIAVFKSRAATPPNCQNAVLVRHLQCKESLELSDAVTNALVRYHAHDARALPAPTEILPPLH